MVYKKVNFKCTAFYHRLIVHLNGLLLLLFDGFELKTGSFENQFLITVLIQVCYVNLCV